MATPCLVIKLACPDSTPWAADLLGRWVVRAANINEVVEVLIAVSVVYCFPVTCQQRSTRFKVQGSRFTVHGSRFTVHGSRFTVQGPRFKVHGSVQGPRFKVQGSRFKVYSFDSYLHLFIIFQLGILRNCVHWLAAEQSSFWPFTSALQFWAICSQIKLQTS